MIVDIIQDTLAIILVDDAMVILDCQNQPEPLLSKVAVYTSNEFTRVFVGGKNA